MRNRWALVLGLAGCAIHHPDLTPDVLVPYETTDGWQNHLRRYQADGPPVLLVHGMGTNHYNWDYREEISLADHLRDAGWDVWVADLRGAPDSEAPSKKIQRAGYSFDDHAQLDLPAAIDVILEETDRTALHYVGHSMGGMLLYTQLTRHPEQIVAGVTFGSPGEFTDRMPLHRLALDFGWLVGKRGTMHTKWLTRTIPPLGRGLPGLKSLANPKNLDPATTNGLLRHALENLSRPTAQQALTWFRSHDLVTADLESWVRPADVPLMFLVGPLDRIVSPRDVAATCALYPNCEFVELSEAGGFSADYGHIDTVLGERARDEIYPLVLDFLNRHLPEAPDGSTSTTSPPEHPLEPAQFEATPTLR